MAEQKFSFSGSFQKSKEYIDTQIELIKLKAISKFSRILGRLAVDLAKLVLSFVAIIFLCFALAFYLSEILGSFSLGFLAAAGIFILLILIFSLASSQIASFVMNTTIRKLMEVWDDVDEEESEERQE